MTKEVESVLFKKSFKFINTAILYNVCIFCPVKRIPRLFSSLVLTILLMSISSNGIENSAIDVSNGPLKEISAAEIINKIKMGQSVSYDNIIVKGNLYLNQLDLPKKNVTYRSRYAIFYGNMTVISSTISIRHSEIKGNVLGQNTIFENSVNFEGTNFGGDVEFHDSIFNNSTIFSGSEFNGNASFSYSRFNGLADFSYTEFTKDAMFYSSQFNSLAEFSGAEFDDDVYFTRSIFNGIVDFGKEIVVSTSTLADLSVSFEDDLLARTWFNGDAYFDSSEFNKIAYFIRNQFAKEINFRGTVFRGGTDFNGSIFKGNNDFMGTVFIGFLNLTGVAFNQLDIYWPHSTLLICNDGPTYLSLIKNFRDLEKYEIADEIYYQYRQWRQSHKSWLDASKYIDILGLITCGYGVKVSYTILSAMIIFLIFGFLYSIINLRQHPGNRNLQIIEESFLFSLVILLSAPAELYPLGANTYRRYAEAITYWPVLERLIGWGLLLLLINTLSRIMIRY